MRTYLAILVSSLLIASSSSANEKIDYLTQIKPILRERCYACHGALKQRAKLRVDTAELLQKGGRHGPTLTPGKSSESLLLERLQAKDDDERMPPEGQPLTTDQIMLIKTWIDQGANAPNDEAMEEDPDKHWAFQQPSRPVVPHIVHERISNPIDAFLAERRQKQNIKPLPRAEKSLLLRRVYLDLIGLPPTQAQMRTFLNDSRPDAYERVVNELLASPQYGERWGRHWMDIWRYTDWYGLGKQLRNSQKHIWHWRDWIIESLNADKGYDEMILEMLAADEVAPTDQQTLRATGFLARNYYLFNRTTWLDSTIEHTSQAFLGLTLQCAKCHDHKYDPLRQSDYYRFRAIFEPHQVRLDPVPGVIDLEKDGLPRAFDAHPEAPTWLHIRGNAKDPDKSNPIEPGIPKVFDFAEYEPTSITLKPEAHRPGIQDFVLRDHIAQAQAELAKAEKNPSAVYALKAAQLRPQVLKAVHAAMKTNNNELAKVAARLEAEWKFAQSEANLAKAKSKKDKDAAKKQLEQAKKRLANPGETFTRLIVSKKAAEGPAESAASINKPYPNISTGRRTALAKWMIDRKNPLTARVAVNHIWLRHFGQALVDPVTDFGRRAKRPLHQKLLDWLANELMDNDWSMKHLHRLIVTSEAYQLSGSTVDANPETKKRDAENRYYWRRKPVRMEAEVIRDSLLHLAKQLQHQQGGPTIDPKLAKSTNRRSLYFTRSRDHVHPFLDMFDQANFLACYRRTESVVPQQALTLANSRLSLQMSRIIADRILVRDENDFIKTAFVMILCREPTEEERQTCVDSLIELRQLLQQLKRPNVEQRARQNLVHALLNHNDFQTIR